jgi:hypothetical protein
LAERRIGLEHALHIILDGRRHCSENCIHLVVTDEMLGELSAVLELEVGTELLAVSSPPSQVVANNGAPLTSMISMSTETAPRRTQRIAKAMLTMKMTASQKRKRLRWRYRTTRWRMDRMRW